MNKKKIKDDSIENIGIMQGFMDAMGQEEPDDEDDDEEGGAKSMMERRPDSPEILMNNLRGDMRSIDARRDELADLVGYKAATETPDSVLAMLQPVLAQQGGGGIGALPQSQDMAQGPQAPMMGPEAGMMPEGMMPEGMPPEGMPPEGMMPEGMMPEGMMPEGMPPPPEQGGIAELMAGMGGGQPPVAMAQGGYVQNFQEGSDEDGVTPAELDTPSEATSAAIYPRDLVTAARDNVARMLTQAPLPAVDLEKTAQARSKVYSKILGDQTDSRQAQMLMGLGQRALGFAANVDDQGRPLRGGFMSRLAGAARTLPGEMAQYIAQADKEQRQLKLLGLQGAEKESEANKAANLRLLETQRKLYTDILKADAKATADAGKPPKNPFGSGREAGALKLFVDLAPAYAKKETTEAEDRLFQTAVSDYTRPVEIEVTDPLTGLKSLRKQQNPLPDYVRTALVARGQAPSRDRAVAPAAGPAGRLPIPAVGATAQDLPPEVVSIAATAPRTTFFDLAGTGTGFVPVLVSGVAKNIPFEFAGKIKPEFQQGTTMLESLRNRVVNTLQENPRFAEGERTQILGELAIGPRLLTNKPAFMNQLVALDNVFETIETKTKTLAEKAEVGVPERQVAQKKLAEIRSMRDLLGIQAKKLTPDQAASAAPGEYFVFDPRKNTWVYAQKRAQ